ncbi:MAG: beta-lactamase family protein [Rhizobiales bacterium]|nr:beta-lactamase family protein [Hyphomicrobiales bacterium]
MAARWTAESGPGGAIALFDRGGLREYSAGGLAVIEHGVPFTADTNHRQASISKHMLAVLLLRAGVPLDAPLGSLLAGASPAVGRVALGRALDMTGALPDMMELLWQDGVPFTTGLGETELSGRALGLPALNAEPGTEMAYSNTGWRLAQIVLSRRLGTSYAQAVDDLMGDLGLGIRFVQDETQLVAGLSSGYWRDGATWRRGRYGFHFSASGGMVASAAALAGWGTALLSGRGPLAGMLDRLTAPRPFRDGGESRYRLGLVCGALGDLAWIGHGGSLPGYRNHMLMAPLLGAGVVVLTNREEDALGPALRILASLAGAPLPAPPRGLVPGLFAAEDGPFWAELSADALSFMGGFESLAADGAGGFASLPAYLDARFRQPGPDVLEGRFGGVARRLVRVPDGTRLDTALAGRWRSRRSGRDMVLREDGTALVPFAGTEGIEAGLTPLPGARALIELSHGPWRHRPCAGLRPDGSLLLASHRSRILAFDRIA